MLWRCRGLRGVYCPLPGAMRGNPPCQVTALRPNAVFYAAMAPLVAFFAFFATVLLPKWVASSNRFRS